MLITVENAWAMKRKLSGQFGSYFVYADVNIYFFIEKYFKTRWLWHFAVHLLLRFKRDLSCIQSLNRVSKIILVSLTFTQKNNNWIQQFEFKIYQYLALFKRIIFTKWIAYHDKETLKVQNIVHFSPSTRVFACKYRQSLIYWINNISSLWYWYCKYLQNLVEV